MDRGNNKVNEPGRSSEVRPIADESLQDSLDDVIASLIDLDEEDVLESSSADQSLMDKGLQNADDFDPETARPIVLTERAARQVKKIVEQEGLESELYLRVAVEGGGCSGLSYKLGLDHRTNEDRIYASFDVEIIVKEEHLMYLEGISIDYPDGLDARGFVFDNPNATDNCGCGESFAV
jgi:iron-sulfur cluster assembly accessory protein